MCKAASNTLAIVFFLSAQVAEADAPLIAPETSKVVEEVRGLYNLPGVTVAVVSGGKAETHGYGVKQYGRSDKVTANTAFPIYSVTKVYVGLAVARMAQEGRISLDDKVKRWIPELNLQDKIAERDVTIKDLMAHGLGVDGADDWLENVPFVSHADVLKRIAEQPQAAPFRSYHYSGIETILLSIVMERASGMRWADVVDRYVSKPLALGNTHMQAFSFAKAAHIAPTGDGWVDGMQPGYKALRPGFDIAPPQGIWPDGSEALALTRSERRKVVMHFQSSTIDPAQSAYSSSNDAAILLQMLLRGGAHNGSVFLTPEILEEVSETEIAFSEDDSDWLKSRGSAAPFEVFDVLGHRCIGHTGGSLGAEAILLACPSIDLGVFVATNGPLYIGGGFRVIARDIVMRHLGKEPQSLRYAKDDLGQRIVGYGRQRSEFAKSVADLSDGQAIPKRNFQDYVGTYRHAFGGELRVRRKGDALILSLGKGARWSLDAAGQDHFVATWNGPRQVQSLHQFHRSSNGEVEAVTLSSYIGSVPLRFTKIEK
jgi:CubicO group peptidase (beta-lactamase class C family)